MKFPNSTKALLDYSDFVERDCEEENGVYRDFASVNDVVRSAGRFLLTNPPAGSARFHQQTAQIRDEAYERWWQFESSRYAAFGQWNHYKECPYCNFGLALSHPLELLEGGFREADLRFCGNCGWWDTEQHLPIQQEGADYSARSIHRRAILKEFSVASAELPVETLRSYLDSRPQLLKEVSPTKLEELVASVFRDFLDCEAIHIGGPNDGGIDLVLLNGSQRSVVQIKRRGPKSGAESVGVIRDFLGAMVLDGTMRGLVVSTAPRFSPNARKAAAAASHTGAVEKIDLVDASRLITLCELTSVAICPPWRRAISPLQSMENGMSRFLTMARSAGL